MKITTDHISVNDSLKVHLLEIGFKNMVHWHKMCQYAAIQILFLKNV